MCAVAVHTGVAEAAVSLGLAVGMVETLGTQAPEAVHLVDTSATVVAGAGRALVDVRVTTGAWRGETTRTEQRFSKECLLCMSARTHTETQLREAKAAARSSHASVL